MKTRNLYSLVALASCGISAVSSSGAYAQSVESEVVSITEYTCDNTSHFYQGWRDNWFVQVGAGVNQPFVERGIGARSPGHDVNRKNMTVTYNVGVGHWFSPYMALRLNALGGALHWNTPTAERPLDGWTKAKYANLNLEFLWDMCNSLGGVNPDRPVSVIPFVGLGGAYTWDIRDGRQGPAAAANILRDNRAETKNSSWTLPVSAGIQFRFRLCRYVDFFAEARASFFGDNWNGVSYGKPIEANVAALGGFNFNIGGRGWDVYNECTYVSQLADLNNQVNMLRLQLSQAGQENAALRAQLPCPEVVEKDCPSAPLLTTVRFAINSDVIAPEEEVNVYNMAEWLKANPKEKVVVAGYADKDTGSAEYNLGLSERRANAVVNALVEKYGVSRDRLSVSADGSSVQPYSENDWNRIVIFSVK